MVKLVNAADSKSADESLMGSSPITGTKYAVVVQLVEHLPSKQIVASSSLVYRSMVSRETIYRDIKSTGWE